MIIFVYLYITVSKNTQIISTGHHILPLPFILFRLVDITKPPELLPDPDEALMFEPDNEAPKSVFAGFWGLGSSGGRSFVTKRFIILGKSVRFSFSMIEKEKYLSLSSPMGTLTSSSEKTFEGPQWDSVTSLLALSTCTV